MTRTIKLSEDGIERIRYALEDFEENLDDLNKEHEWHLNKTDLSNIKKYLRGLLKGKIRDPGNISWWNNYKEYDFYTVIEEDGHFNPKDWLSDKQIRKLGIKRIKNVINSRKK